MGSTNEYRVDSEGPEIRAWQIQKHWNDNDKFGAKNVRIVPQKEERGEEIIEFDLVFAEGKSIKANLSIKPRDPKPDGTGAGKNLVYSADFSGLSPSEKIAANKKFCQLIIEDQLRFWPAGKSLRIISYGDNRIEAAKVMEEQMLLPDNVRRFREKGISVFINYDDKPIIPKQNEITPEEPDQQPKPKPKAWDVPKSLKPRKPW